MPETDKTEETKPDIHIRGFVFYSHGIGTETISCKHGFELEMHSAYRAKKMLSHL